MTSTNTALAAAVSKMSFAQVVEALASRRVEFNEQAPHDDLRQDLLFDIAMEQATLEADLLALASRAAVSPHFAGAAYPA